MPWVSRSKSRRRRAPHPPICHHRGCRCAKSPSSIRSTDNCVCPWRRSVNHLDPFPGTVGQYRSHLFIYFHFLLKVHRNSLFVESQNLRVFKDATTSGGLPVCLSDTCTVITAVLYLLTAALSLVPVKFLSRKVRKSFDLIGTQKGVEKSWIFSASNALPMDAWWTICLR